MSDISIWRIGPLHSYRQSNVKRRNTTSKLNNDEVHRTFANYNIHSVFIHCFMKIRDRNDHDQQKFILQPNVVNNSFASDEG
jgi:hypothetical protein